MAVPPALASTGTNCVTSAHLFGKLMTVVILLMLDNPYTLRDDARYPVVVYLDECDCPRGRLIGDATGRGQARNTHCSIPIGIPSKNKNRYSGT